MTLTPESQQAAFNLRHWRNILQDRNVEVQTVAEVLAAGSGSVNLITVLEQAEKLLSATPVSESHAALADANDEDIQFLHKWAEMCGSTQQAMRLNGIVSRLSALRAHPAGGVSEDVVERAMDAFCADLTPAAIKYVRGSDGKYRFHMRQNMERALRAAGIGARVVPSFRVEVHTMKESHQTTYWVALIRSDCPKDKFAPSAADGYITPSKFLNRDHAYIDAADWAAFLGVAAPSLAKQ